MSAAARLGLPAAGALALVLLLGFFRLRNPYLFFADDVQEFYLPLYDFIGRELREGRWPWVTDRSWLADNLLNETQFGLFNPVSLAAYALFTGIENNATRAFAHLLFVLLILQGGTHLFLRRLGVPARYAVQFAFVSTLGAYTLYYRAHAWVGELYTMMWIPWLLAALWSHRRSRPFEIAAAAYLAGSAGFAQYVLLAVVLAAVRIGRVATHSLRDALRLGLPALIGFALALPAYLPAVLAFEQMARKGGGFANTNWFRGDLLGILSAGFPAFLPRSPAWGTEVLRAPIHFIFIGLPGLLAAIAIRLSSGRRRPEPQRTVEIAILTVLALLVSASQFGPFRWPMRYYSIFALLVLAWIALEIRVLDRIRVLRPRATLLAFAGYVAFFLWAALSEVPEQARTILRLAALGIPLAWLSMKAARFDGRGGILALHAATVFGLLLVLPPNKNHFHTVPYGFERLNPWGLAEEDGVVVFHQNYQNWMDRRYFREVAVSNMIFWGRPAAFTGYSPVGHRRLQEEYCLNDHGAFFCYEGVKRLFGEDPSLGLRIDDFIGVNAVVSAAAWDKDLAPLLEGRYERRGDGAFTFLYKRPQRRVAEARILKPDGTPAGGVSMTVRRDVTGPARIVEGAEALRVIGPENASGRIVIPAPFFKGYAVFTPDGRSAVCTGHRGLFVSCPILGPMRHEIVFAPFRMIAGMVGVRD